MARVRRDGFAPVSKTFSRRSDAERWARGVEADMEAGRWAAKATAAPMVVQALQQYSAGALAALKGAETYAYWLAELQAVDMARKPVNEVTAQDVTRWRDALQAQGLAAGTVVRKLGLLGGFFSWCQREQGWIDANPVRSVRKPRVSDARDRVLTDEERGYLLAAAHTSRAHWLADALVVLLQSAMRRSELWGLRLGAVDFEGATAHLADTKNGTTRDVPLCPEALAAMRRLADAARERGSDALIPVSDPHAVSLAFRRTLARARSQYVKDCADRRVPPSPGFLADVHLHDLRHCAVTAWASTGALSLLELKAISGHKDTRMLARYTHLSAEKLAAKLATLTTQAQA